MANVDLKKLAQVNYNNIFGVPNLNLNGKQIWQKQVNVDDEPFNYTGIDANGEYEGSPIYDGTAVKYAIGKISSFTPNYTYETVTPTPTTREEYIGKYIYNSTTYTYTEITETNVDNLVTVGTTACLTRIFNGYKTTTDKCNAYSSEYYGGYDFTAGNTSFDDAIALGIPQNLVIPVTYKGKPVTEILSQAFYGYYSTEVDQETYAGDIIKNIVFGNNLEVIRNKSFYGNRILDQNGTKILEFPEGLQVLEDGVFAKMDDNLIEEIILPTTIESVNIGFYSGVGSVSKLVYKCENAEMIAGTSLGGFLDTFKTAVFEESVESLNGILVKGTGSTITTMVFRHSENAPITLNLSGNPKDAKAITIYTDNLIVRNYDWSALNITPTFLPLSDYVE